MATVSIDRLREVLDRRFNGVLLSGSHRSGAGQCCAVELLSVAMDQEFGDDPAQNRTWDYRILNDISVGDDVRTEHMIPVISAYAGSLDWPQPKQLVIISRLVIGTVNRLIAELTGLPEAVREQCRSAADLEAAERAARAAGAAYAADAAAYAAAIVTYAAAHAAERADCTRVFITACQVWVNAAAENPITK